MKIFGGYVYILTNKTNRVLYCGVTDNLARRASEHKQRLAPGFTAKYHVHKLVWYEHHERIENAITREKQLKGGSRKKKIDLINAMNPTWVDLYESILQ